MYIDQEDVEGYILLRKEDEEVKKISQELLKLEEYIGIIEELAKKNVKRLNSIKDEVDKLPSVSLLEAYKEALKVMGEGIKENQELLQDQSDLLAKSQAKQADRKQLIKRLYKERDKLKRDWVYRTFLDKAANEIMQIRDDLARYRKSDESSAHFGKVYRVLDKKLIKILNAWDISSIQERPKRFDPQIQEATGTKRVNTEAEDGMVLEVLSPGYQRNGKIIQNQRVIVGQFKEEAIS